MAAVGVGAGFGAIAMAAFGHRVNLRKLIASASLGFAASIALSAMHGSFAFALVTLALAGFGAVLPAICINTLLQTEAPDALRGRVIGFYSFVVLGFAPFGSLQAGWIAEHYGVHRTFLVGALICAVGSFVFERARVAGEALTGPALSGDPMTGEVVTESALTKDQG